MTFRFAPRERPPRPSHLCVAETQMEKRNTFARDARLGFAREREKARARETSPDRRFRG
jgi:hypothetical protein